MDMKTSSIFFACLLVIGGANIEEWCNKKARTVVDLYCYLSCKTLKSDLCALCIRHSRHYDQDCQGQAFVDKCSQTSVKIMSGDCKNKCNGGNPARSRQLVKPVDDCYACILNHKGLACWTDHTVNRLFKDYGHYEDYEEYQPLYSDV